MGIPQSVAIAAQQIKDAYAQAAIKGTGFKGEQILDNLAEAIRLIGEGGGGGLICGDIDETIEMEAFSWIQR